MRYAEKNLEKMVRWYILSFMPKYKLYLMFACCKPSDTLGYTHCVQVFLETRQNKSRPPYVVFPEVVQVFYILTILYVAVTVEGLKAKLQKKEREADNKKQELVSDWDTAK